MTSSSKVDLQTLVRAEFTFTTAGKIEYEAILQTTSQTTLVWHASAVINLFLGLQRCFAWSSFEITGSRQKYPLGSEWRSGLLLRS